MRVKNQMLEVNVEPLLPGPSRSGNKANITTTTTATTVTITTIRSRDELLGKQLCNLLCKIGDLVSGVVDKLSGSEFGFVSRFYEHTILSSVGARTSETAMAEDND